MSPGAWVPGMLAPASSSTTSNTVPGYVLASAQRAPPCRGQSGQWVQGQGVSAWAPPPSKRMQRVEPLQAFSSPLLVCILGFGLVLFGGQGSALFTKQRMPLSLA